MKLITRLLRCCAIALNKKKMKTTRFENQTVYRFKWDLAKVAVLGKTFENYYIHTPTEPKFIDTKTPRSISIYIERDGYREL